ncbi:MAG: transglutaminase domain-containing protein [Planctomycetaceae bacterium]|nr:transglutaminase domain-containing protein [Planctomycetaceae bacterium]
MSARASLALATLLLLIPHVSSLSGDDSRPDGKILDDTWQVVYIQGQRVGYIHSLTWESGEGDAHRIWSESRTQMSITRFGGSLTMTVIQKTEEDRDGNLLSFQLDTDNQPVSHTVVSGVVKGDTLHITTTAAGKSKESTQPWDNDVKSPVYQDRLMEDDPVEPGETQTMRIFDPQFLKVGTVTVNGLEPATTELLDGSTPALDRVSISHSLVPLMKMTAYQDEVGETVKTETNLLGMVAYTVSREEALKTIEGKQLDLALDTLVKVDQIKDAHRQKKIVYDVTIDGPSELMSIPKGSTQTVERLRNNTIRVTVQALPLSPGEKQEPTPVDDSYLASSRYLECGHSSVIKHADAAAKDLTNPTDIAIAMERYVHQNLNAKNFSTAMATAAEVAVSLEGDCTEHAMLLAGMLRVKGIPSRVAIGLVYVDRLSAFGGHMWTEAYLEGRWVPLDATLGYGGIGAGHLKFADSSLSDDGPAPVTVFVPLVSSLGKMSIKVVDDNEK